MRKKCSYSEENFLSASSAKVSEYFRQNPRFPKKMKPVKTKYPNPTVRTVGQLNCGGKNSFSTTIGLQNPSGGEPARKDSDLEVWNKLHRTLSNTQSPRNPHPGDFTLSEPARFCSVTKKKDEHQIEPKVPASPTVQTSESGIQVNIFHCQECRRHIEYGKTYKLETICTDSDPEKSLSSTAINCIRCERKQGHLIGSGDDDPENSAREDRRLSLGDNDSTPRDRSPSRERNSTPRSDTFFKNGAEVQTVMDKDPQAMTFSHTEGGKQFWSSNIKLTTAAIFIIPLILHIAQTETFSAISSTFNFYLGNIMVQEETEDFSIVGWIFDLFFGVQGVTKPLPLFLYLF